MSDDMVKRAVQVISEIQPEWVQTKENQWQWDVAGSVGFLTQNLNDGTWSYTINNSGYFGYSTKAKAQAIAEDAMRRHLLMMISNFESAYSKIRAIIKTKGKRDE